MMFFGIILLNMQVVQIYIEWVPRSWPPPPPTPKLQLAGFKRVRVEAGMVTKTTIFLQSSIFEIYDEQTDEMRLFSGKWNNFETLMLPPSAKVLVHLFTPTK